MAIHEEGGFRGGVRKVLEEGGSCKSFYAFFGRFTMSGTFQNFNFFSKKIEKPIFSPGRGVTHAAASHLLMYGDA